MPCNRLFLITYVGLAISFSACHREADSMEEQGLTSNIPELSVDQIHLGFRNGDFTSEELVQEYLKRINQFDKPTGLNSIIIINPGAIVAARQMDKEFQETGTLRPLHGVPLIVKDNYHTAGIQTTAGSVALKGFIPQENAYQVQKLIEAGAIILAKSNMAEWAFSPRHTISSIQGETLNPYNFDFVPAGSSGGTAAAIAANFGTIGIGTDTGNSIRGPSSHCALVGFRSSLGLTSRQGIFPLYLRNDVGGPMCRTVEDATRVLDVIAGYDPQDPITRHSDGKIPLRGYLPYLKKDGLNGLRIGVVRQLMEDIDPQIDSLFNRALSDLTSQGATIVDPFDIPAFDSLRQNQWCSNFKSDIEEHLVNYVKWDSLKTIEDIIRIGGVSNVVGNRLQYFADIQGRRGEAMSECGDPFSDPLRIAFREAIEGQMEATKVDVLVYPSWNYPPARTDRFIEDYKGDNSQVIAPHTGQPAFTVPMGYTQGSLPAGIQFLGRIFDEPTLIQACYAYEQSTNHRRPPEAFSLIEASAIPGVR